MRIYHLFGWQWRWRSGHMAITNRMSNHCTHSHGFCSIVFGAAAVAAVAVAGEVVLLFVAAPIRSAFGEFAFWSTNP